MSGLLHPVGPHSAATYWLRRALVVGVLAAVIALVVALVTPAPRQQAVPAAAPSPSAVMGTAMTASARPSPSPSLSGSPAPASPSSTGATVKPSATAPPKAKPKANAKPRAKQTTPPAKSPNQPVASCAPSQLRVTLDGPSQLSPGQPTTFTLSVANAAATRCLARVAGDNFELRIYSGADRIWSSADCPAVIRPLKKQLAAKQAVRWQQKWNGRRSATKCASRPELPRPGTYITTAELSGAGAVQARTILRG